MEFSPFWCSVPWTLAALVSLSSRPYSFTSVVCWADFPPFAADWKLSLGNKLRQSKGSSCLFLPSPRITVPCFLIFSVLRSFFRVCWLAFLVGSGRRIDLVPVTPSWLEVEAPDIFLLIFFSFPNNSVKTLIVKVFFKEAFVKCQDFNCVIPVSPHDHAGFLNLISIWQLKSKAQSFAGLDLSKSVSPDAMCILWFQKVFNASLQSCQRSCLTHRASLASHSLKESSYLQPGFWGIHTHMHFVRHACMPVSHPATWDEWEGSKMDTK